MAYNFLSTDAATIKARMVARFEELAGRTLQASDPMMVAIDCGCADVVELRENLNYVGQQNIPSSSVGENLDQLAGYFRGVTRLSGDHASCTMRFTLSEAQSTAQTIPLGTRVSTNDGLFYFATTAALTIAAGQTTGTVSASCTESGSDANGYDIGKITKLVDVFPLYASCTNTTASSGGTDDETDEDLLERYELSTDTYSTAGSENSYAYHALTADSDIGDVAVTRQDQTRTATLTVYDGCCFIGGEQLDTTTLVVKTASGGTTAALATDYTADYTDGHLLKITVVSGGILDGLSTIWVSVTQVRAGYVDIYALMKDGTIPSQTVLSKIETACNEKTVRPVTDVVTVKTPTQVSYNITMSYTIGISRQTEASEIQTAVTNAVAAYVKWQSAVMGRNINPNELEYLVKDAGAYTVTITSPTYTTIEDGQVASIGTQSVTYSGVVEE